MKNRIIRTIAAGLFCLWATAAATEAYAMNESALDARERSMLAIAALSAAGELDKLPAALARGLDDGLTVNEIKEILVQLYAYAGFPRSLNALDVFQTVLAEREARGIEDLEGKAPSAPPPGRGSLEFGTENQTKLIGRPVGGGLYEFAPAIDQFLKAHLFGDIFQRDNLDWKHRELATIAMLAAIPGLRPQLEGHLGIGMHNGLSAEQLRAAADTLAETLGQARAEAMRAWLDNLD